MYLFTRVTTGSSCRTRSLCRLLNGIFLRTITAVIGTTLLLCLLNTVRFSLMDLTTEQDRNRTAVQGIQHLLEDIEGLQLHHIY